MRTDYENRYRYSATLRAFLEYHLISFKGYRGNEEEIEVRSRTHNSRSKTALFCSEQSSGIRLQLGCCIFRAGILRTVHKHKASLNNKFHYRTVFARGSAIHASRQSLCCGFVSLYKEETIPYVAPCIHEIKRHSKQHSSE